MSENSITLIQGDAFEALSDLTDNYGHATVVDYPWTVQNTDRAGAANNPHEEDWEMRPNDGLGGVLESVARSTVDGGWVFVFTDDHVYPEFREVVEETLTYRKTLIWDTEYIGMGHYFRSRHTPILAATVGETDRYVNEQATVIREPAPQRTPGESPEYPTKKPVSLYRQFLDPVVDAGERILEPFCGTAPAASVARAIGCGYWGVDEADAAIRHAKAHTEQTTTEDFQ